MSGGGAAPLKCDGWPEKCSGPITHIDEKGYVYCRPCGVYRKEASGRRCRLLARSELRTLESGRPLPSYDRQKRRPKDCECDNTHEAAGTCCMPCWRRGFSVVAPASGSVIS